MSYASYFGSLEKYFASTNFLKFYPDIRYFLFVHLSHGHDFNIRKKFG